MQCIDKRKVSCMSWLKKLIPYAIGGLTVWTGTEFLGDEMPVIAPTIIEKVAEIAESVSTVELITEPEPEPAVICPPLPPLPPPTVCPQIQPMNCPPPLPPRVCPRVVACPPPLPPPPPQVFVRPKPGCHVDWKTGETSGFAPKNQNLRCTFDYVKKTVNTEFSRTAFKERQGAAIRRLR